MRRSLLMAIGFTAMATTATTFGQDANLERGKYLVEEVARCQECHTPRTETGEFDGTHWMKGATLIGVPPAPAPAVWHQQSPDLTSTSALWTLWGQDGFAKSLQTATKPQGGKAGPPMPAYMLKGVDADAMAAYLK